MTKILLLDLFAGAGGMTEGFKKNGSFSLAEAVEMDRSAAATYAANHGTSHIRVADIAAWRRDGRAPRSDVVIGGPPCQGFSALGKRDVQDVRNGLWREYALTIVDAQPAYFVLENVPQFLESRQYRSLRRWTHKGGPLADYAVHPFVLNAADFGAFQSRKRAVLIGRHRDLPSVPPPVGAWASKHKSVRQAFEGITPGVEQVDLPERTQQFDGVELPGWFTSAELHVTRRYERLSRDRFTHIPKGGNRFDLPDHLKAPCWLSHTTGSGDVMGRLHWDRPSVTVRTEFFKPEKGRYLHPEEDRAITHFEAATLQGFPSTYRWVGSKVQIARQIGNAVPIQLSSALADHISSLPR